jgi:PilZ domain
VRSSSRIPKEIPIVLIGSDLDGSVFSEPTKTVLLSLHGAGVLSRHKLCAEQEMVLRCPDRNKEAEIRVAGQLGSQQGVHTYGVAFIDPSLKFWDVEFPSLSPDEMERGLLSLVCNSCKALEKIDDTGIEADICATGEGVLRFCKRCGSLTLWKPAQPQTLPAVSPESLSPVDDAQMALFPSSSPPEPAPASSSVVPPAPAASSSLLAAPTQTSRPTPSQTQAAVYYEQRGVVLTLPPPREPDTARVNRRKHARVKVNYSACVRHPERGDDIVTCEDMSRGGLRFTSRKSYYERSLIEVAVPYTPGQPAIFVPAQIVFVQELPEQQLFRYGVAYLQLPKPSNSF